MRLVYVAAPLSAPSVQDRTLHRDRAAFIGRLIAMSGEVPIVPHLTVGGLFPGYPLHPEEAGVRKLAMDLCLSLVGNVASCDGRMVVLKAPDGSISNGCQEEMEWFQEKSSEPIRLTVWDDWKAEAKWFDLWGEWNSLRLEPMVG